jgi:hypothetical protein
VTPAPHRLLAAMEIAGRAGHRLERLAIGDRILLEAAIDVDGEDEGAMRVVDAFIQRFQQLVEQMIRRLYPALYRRLEADHAPPLVTLLAYLEGNGLIDSEQRWATIIDLRNKLVHEYPLTEEERAAALHVIVGMVPAILADLAAAFRFITDNRLVGSDT